MCRRLRGQARSHRDSGCLEDRAISCPNVNELGQPPPSDLCCTPTLSFLVAFMGRCLPFILLLIALPASAQIYKYTDANGNTAYSNQPPDGVKAQPVELPPLNSVEPQSPKAPEPPADAPDREQPGSCLRGTGADRPADHRSPARQQRHLHRQRVDQATPARSASVQAVAGRSTLRPTQQRTDPATGEHRSRLAQPRRAGHRRGKHRSAESERDLHRTTGA